MYFRNPASGLAASQRAGGARRRFVANEDRAEPRAQRRCDRIHLVAAAGGEDDGGDARKVAQRQRDGTPVDWMVDRVAAIVDELRDDVAHRARAAQLLGAEIG